MRLNNVKDYNTLRKLFKDDLPKLIFTISKKENTGCLHKKCTECQGTGIKEDGSLCIHMISCPCPNCNLANFQTCN